MEPCVFPNEQKLNLHAFEKIQPQAKRGAAEWPEGQYVGLVKGKAIAVSPDFELVAQKLDKIESNRLRGTIFRIGDDYSKPIKVLLTR